MVRMQRTDFAAQGLALDAAATGAAARALDVTWSAATAAVATRRAEPKSRVLRALIWL